MTRFKEFMKGEGGKQIMQDMIDNGGVDYPGGKEEFEKILQEMGNGG
jgi:hypothetical protein